MGGGSNYVRGVIMGVMTSICIDTLDDDFLKGTSNCTVRILKDNQTGDHVYRIRTTIERYNLFANIIEKTYLGVCEFDIYD